MGAEAMRGRVGVVTKPIGELDSGLVKVDGETWTARSYFEHEPIPPAPASRSSRSAG